MMIPNEKNTVLSNVPFDVTFVTSVLLSVREEGLLGNFHVCARTNQVSLITSYASSN